MNRLTVVTMLVNTNDVFTSLDSLPLRGRGVARATNAYDAGSERHNELSEFIPGPCCGNPSVRDPEGELIRHHEASPAGAISTPTSTAGPTQSP